MKLQLLILRGDRAPWVGTYIRVRGVTFWAHDLLFTDAKKPRAYKSEIPAFFCRMRKYKGWLRLLEIKLGLDAEYLAFPWMPFGKVLVKGEI